MKKRVILVAGLAAALAVAGASGPARADGGTPGADVSVAQSLGGRELTVVLRRVRAVPGPLRVDVVTHAGAPAGTLAVTVVPTGLMTADSSLPWPGIPTESASVTLGARPGPYGTDLRIDRAGPWEVTLSDGRQTARIPFVVLGQVVTPPERWAYGGVIGGGAFLLAGIVVAAAGRRRWTVFVPAAGLIGAVAVAVTGAMLSASLPTPADPGGRLDPTVANAADPYATPVRGDLSRPPVTVTLLRSSFPAGAESLLELSVTDAATGLPADDLVVHDSALLHMMVVAPDGALDHLHPIRTAPGRYAVQIRPGRPGRYAVAAELARRGGGVQLLRPTGFEAVGGAALPGRPASVPVGGTRTVDGTEVQVVMPRAVAAEPVTVHARIGRNPDLQPWLGMLGHLIVVGPMSTPDGAREAPVWIHAHSMDSALSMMDMSGADMVPMSVPAGESLPDETVSAYGPIIGFTVAFPVPGTYRLWIQAERAYRIITVPVTVQVAAP